MKFFNAAAFLMILFLSCSQGRVHVWEPVEITLHAEKSYDNPYTDVSCWIQLKGPDFDKRVYGFWDGGNVFKVRFAATEPGRWSWTSGSSASDDPGLQNQKGVIRAVSWSEKEKNENPNRRGFIRSTENGHALQYADGTPFFFLGDTWWAAASFRYPLTGIRPDPDWVPGPEGLCLENIIEYRKQQGYNSLTMIACFPNWEDDAFNRDYVDADGIHIRGAWARIDTIAKNMHDDDGNLPFAKTGIGPLADFDRLNPAYFKNLDKKMDYIQSVGFVPFFETIRRDHGPSMKAYFEWPDVYVRFIQYCAARYGAYNMIFSPIHLDWLQGACLPPEDYNEAINVWYETYGPLPFEQPVTPLINEATHTTFGTGEKIKWMTMHSVGNSPRHHGFYPLIEEQFNFDPPMPTANLEAYYPHWIYNTVCETTGEWPEPNSERDNYFGRTQAYGSVLSGGLSGHIYGTGAYDGSTIGEERNRHPYIWEALTYPAGEQVGYLREFIESEGGAYQNLQPAGYDLHPRKAKDSPEDGLDGWSFMMRAPDRDLALLYFENASEIPKIEGLMPAKKYTAQWFNPLSGDWQNPNSYKTDNSGSLSLAAFPDGKAVSRQDWALKLKIIH